MGKAPNRSENTVESSPSLPAHTSAPAVDNALRQRRNNFVVMAVLGFDVIFGAAIAMAGHLLLENDAVTLAGAGFATLGVILMLLYQLVGRER